MIRRRRLPAVLEERFHAFCAVLGEVEPAKAALTDVMPSTRAPGRSLPDALLEFDERLARADDAMPAWRCAELEADWQACAGGLAEARERADRLRLEVPELGGFEGLIWTVGELLRPLEAFEQAADRFRHLRV